MFLFRACKDARGSELLAEARMQVNEDRKRNILRSGRSVNTPHDIPERNDMDAPARRGSRRLPPQEENFLKNLLFSIPFGIIISWIIGKR